MARAPLAMLLLAAFADCARAVTPACGGGGCGPARLIAPLSTATVTSRRPRLRWTLGAGDDGARIELCRDRACTQPLASFDALGTAAAPAADLPTGVVFWRLHGRAGAALDAAGSPTWQFTVGARSAPVDTSWGTTLDVNGDGFADVIVAAPGDNVGDHVGYGSVYLGSARGLATTPSRTLPGTSNWFVGAGDTNGDGFDDVIDVSIRETTLGPLVVYLGGPDGLAAAPSVTLVGPRDGAFAWGASVASAGDVNGDGYADVVVSDLDAEGSSVVSVLVFLGSAAGLPTRASATLAIDGAAQLGSFVARIASAGDFDGDGFGDVVVAGPFDAPSTAATVLLGSAAGLSRANTVTLADTSGLPPGSNDRAITSEADVDGDGRCDVAVLSVDHVDFGMHARDALQLYAGSARRASAAPVATFTVLDGIYPAHAGDVDGDGFADLLVYAEDGVAPARRVSLFHGGATGLGAAPDTVFTVPVGPSEPSFVSTAGAGDVDGDGFAEIVVGAAQPDVGPGHAYVYRGSPTGLGRVPATTLAGTNDTFGAVVVRRARSAGARVRVAATAPARAPHS